MARRRRTKIRILLPGERESRRWFLKMGLLGAALLAAGGGFYLSKRETRPASGFAGSLRIFSPEEAAVLLALAHRVLPQRPGTSRPADADLARRIDATAAGLPSSAQRHLKRTVRLFESALSGVFDGVPRTFTESTPAEQDRRIAAWSTSRVALRRSEFHALHDLVVQACDISPDGAAARDTPASAGETPIPAQSLPPSEAAVQPPDTEDGARVPVRLHGGPPARRGSDSAGADALRPTPQPHVKSAPIAPRRVESEVVDHAGLEPPLEGDTNQE